MVLFSVGINHDYCHVFHISFTLQRQNFKYSKFKSTKQQTCDLTSAMSLALSNFPFVSSSKSLPMVVNSLHNDSKDSSSLSDMSFLMHWCMIFPESMLSL